MQNSTSMPSYIFIEQCINATLCCTILKVVIFKQYLYLVFRICRVRIRSVFCLLSCSWCKFLRTVTVIVLRSSAEEQVQVYLFFAVDKASSNVHYIIFISRLSKSQFSKFLFLFRAVDEKSLNKLCDFRTRYLIEAVYPEVDKASLNKNTTAQQQVSSYSSFCNSTLCNLCS